MMDTTQVTAVLDFIKNNGSITQKEASDELGVGRLAARISDLKKLGHEIKTEMIVVPTRYGKTRVARYSLI